MRRAILLVALLVSATAGALPRAEQAVPLASATFPQLLQAYRRDRPLEAVAAFGKWPEKRVLSEARLPPGVQDTSSLAALALFHTETAMRNLKFGHLAQGVSPLISHAMWGLSKTFEPHSSRSYEIVIQLLQRSKEQDDAALLGFVRSWYVAAISHCYRWNQPVCMGSLLEKGESDLGRDDVEWLLAYGSIHSASHYTRAQAKQILYKFLFMASVKPTWAFRRALDRNPDLAEARLRWARVMYVLLNDPRAVPELERAYADATRLNHTFVRHLAALFLGEIHEEAGRRDRAEHYYADAVEIRRAHTASVALGQLLVRTGRRDEGFAVGRQMFGSEGPAVGPIVDPYPLFRYGQYWQNESRLQAMREMVRVR
jgi:hypothetical protein